MSGNQGSQRGLTKRQSEGLKTSKVKNADGTLKVVYHFTDNMEFTTFAKGDIGFHFGSTEQAQNRGKNLKKNGRIIEAYLDIKNPVRVSVDIMSWNPAPLAMRLYGDGILSKIDYLTVLELEKQMLLPIL